MALLCPEKRKSSAMFTHALDSGSWLSLTLNGLVVFDLTSRGCFATWRFHFDTLHSHRWPMGSSCRSTIDSRSKPACQASISRARRGFCQEISSASTSSRRENVFDRLADRSSEISKTPPRADTLQKPVVNLTRISLISITSRYAAVGDGTTLTLHRRVRALYRATTISRETERERERERP